MGGLRSVAVNDDKRIDIFQRLSSSPPRSPPYCQVLHAQARACSADQYPVGLKVPDVLANRIVFDRP